MNLFKLFTNSSALHSLHRWCIYFVVLLAPKSLEAFSFSTLAFDSGIWMHQQKNLVARSSVWNKGRLEKEPATYRCNLAKLGSLSDFCLEQYMSCIPYGHKAPKLNNLKQKHILGRTLTFRHCKICGQWFTFQNAPMHLIVLLISKFLQQFGIVSERLTVFLGKFRNETAYNFLQCHKLHTLTL